MRRSEYKPSSANAGAQNASSARAANDLGLIALLLCPLLVQTRVRRVERVIFAIPPRFDVELVEERLALILLNWVAIESLTR
jgi:hypothetical protein